MDKKQLKSPRSSFPQFWSKEFSSSPNLPSTIANSEPPRSPSSPSKEHRDDKHHKEHDVFTFLKHGKKEKKSKEDSEKKSHHSKHSHKHVIPVDNNNDGRTVEQKKTTHVVSVTDLDESSPAVFPRRFTRGSKSKEQSPVVEEEKEKPPPYEYVEARRELNLVGVDDVAEGMQLLNRLHTIMGDLAKKKSVLEEHEQIQTEAIKEMEQRLVQMQKETRVLEEELTTMKLQNEDLQELSLKKDEAVKEVEKQLTTLQIKYEKDMTRKEEAMQTSARILTEKIKEFEKIINTQSQEAKTLKEENEKLKEQIQKMEDAVMCVICNERAADVLVLPCRHQSICSNCANGNNVKQCCICRSDITQTYKAFINHNQ